MTQSDIAGELADLNIRIGEAESKGDAEAKAFLGDAIAPVLGFRRASGKLDGRAEYLQAIAPSHERTTAIEAVEVYGNRALVRCVVTMKSAAGEKRFHNIRLFVKHEGKWRLLGWTNEAM
jgi:uncharacterized protein DUF4440